MLREIAHFFRHAPGVVRLAARMRHADLFHLLMGRAERAGMAEWRSKLVGDLQGRILEIGCGTGFMFRHYPQNAEVIATEPAESFFELARKAAPKSPAKITLRVASAEDLPFHDDTFDAVVVASVLCSVSDVERSLAEIRRVLKPEGEARLIEHVKSPRPLPGLLMDLFNPLWRLWNRQGCNMNRRTAASLQSAGFHLAAVEPFQLFVPGLPAFPTLWIRAQPGKPAPKPS